MIVDAHVHVCPHEMHAKAIKNWFEKNAWFEICYGEDAPRSVIQSLDKYGIDKAVILAFNWARSHHAKAPPNEYVAKLTEEYPDRFVGFASVDPMEGDAATELESAICDLGLRGLKLAPSIQLFHPNDKRCYPVYKKAEDLRIPILFHAGAGGFPNTYSKFGNPLLLDDVAVEFPQLNMIVAHLGGGFFREMLMLMVKNRNVYSDVSGIEFFVKMFTLHPMSEQDLFKRFIDIVGHDRILFGSDNNFPRVKTVLGILDDLGVKKEDRERIMSKNIERLLAIRDEADEGMKGM